MGLEYYDFYFLLPLKMAEEHLLSKAYDIKVLNIILFSVFIYQIH